MIIVVASQHGAGKTTATELLAERLGLRLLDMGAKFRSAAKERGMSIEEFSRFLTNNPKESEKFDREMDDFQKKKIEAGGIVVNSNVGAMLAGGAGLKVFLECPLDVRAKRVFQGQRRESDTRFASVEEAKKDLVERDRNDSERYKRLYGFDMFDKSHYDLVLDTSEMAKNEVVQKIMDELKRRNPNAF